MAADAAKVVSARLVGPLKGDQSPVASTPITVAVAATRMWYYVGGDSAVCSTEGIITGDGWTLTCAALLDICVRLEDQRQAQAHYGTTRSPGAAARSEAARGQQRCARAWRGGGVEKVLGLEVCLSEVAGRPALFLSFRAR